MRPSWVALPSWVLDLGALGEQRLEDRAVSCSGAAIDRDLSCSDMAASIPAIVLSFHHAPL
jgi:hypothetical protein